MPNQLITLSKDVIYQMKRNTVYALFFSKTIQI